MCYTTRNLECCTASSWRTSFPLSFVFFPHFVECRQNTSGRRASLVSLFSKMSMQTFSRARQCALEPGTEYTKPEEDRDRIFGTKASSAAERRPHHITRFHNSTLIRCISLHCFDRADLLGLAGTRGDWYARAARIRIPRTETANLWTTSRDVSLLFVSDVCESLQLQRSRRQSVDNLAVCCHVMTPDR